MRLTSLVPVLAAALLAAGCGGEGGTNVGPTASVRYLNATTGMAGSGGFTLNGQFAPGSALASGQATPACSRVAAGAASVGFGAASAAGTGLTGAALIAVSQDLTNGGDYIVAAIGPAASPALLLIDNTYPGTLAASQAAVRFVNLAPGPGTPANTFVVWVPELSPESSPLGANFAVGVPTAYKTVPSGTASYTVAQTPGLVMVVPSGTVSVAAGSANTLAIIPNASSGFQVVNLPRCP